MNVREMIRFKTRRDGWRAVNAAVLLAAYAAI